MIPGIRFKEKEVTDGNTYEVYTGPSRNRALEFLRGTEVREERKYVIVETPEGSLGKDLIMIFDEVSSQRIEFSDRKPLPELTKSKTHCTKCGYPVLPAGRWPGGINVKDLILLEDMKEKGVGFYCSRCETAWCPFCLRGDDTATCQICGAQMVVYRESVGQL